MRGNSNRCSECTAKRSFFTSFFEETSLRKTHSTQRLLGSVPICQVDVNYGSRDSIVPVLRALQELNSRQDVAAQIMKLIENDVNPNTRKDLGRDGKDYWQVLVLAFVRLECDFTYDRLQEARRIVGRECELCRQLDEPMPTRLDVYGPNTLQAFIARTEQVMKTARRRVLNGESFPNSDKLFRMFEPHFQLY